MYIQYIILLLRGDSGSSTSFRHTILRTLHHTMSCEAPYRFSRHFDIFYWIISLTDRILIGK